MGLGYFILILWGLSILSCLLPFLGLRYGLNKELKINFTKEEIKGYKSTVKSNPFTRIFIILFPFLNTVFGLIFIFGYEHIIDKNINDMKEYVLNKRINEVEKLL